MSAFSAQVRAAVVERAANCCEYCRLPVLGQVATFPLDHVLPRNSQGGSELSNLALACPHCNACKWTFTDGIDPETGQALPLFNPRTERWSDHFSWSAENPLVLVGLTATGRATIQRLHMNSAKLLVIRRLLAELGIQLAVDDHSA